MAPRSTAFILSFFFALATGGAASALADKLSVFVSIVPQKYFVKQIGKALVNVQVMVPPGASPATYEPKPRQMAALAKADAYISIGVPFERAWLPKIAATNSELRMIASDRGIQKMASQYHAHGHTHSDLQDGDDDETDLDPHIWTSPPLVMVQARTILAALQTLDPSHAHIYEANHKTFVQTLRVLDDELHHIFDDRRGSQFMVFHPSWGYFAHTYGLVQVPAELEGKAPKPAQLKKLITHAKSKNIKVIFVQPQFSAKSAQLIAKAIGGTVIAADPLALDWEANLRRQAAQFDEALR